MVTPNRQLAKQSTGDPSDTTAEAAVAAADDETCRQLDALFELIRLPATIVAGLDGRHGARSRLGRYWLERVIGQGGGGTVYVAFDEDLERRVALKVPHPELVAAGAGESGLLREARLAARLNHSAIVSVYDVGVDGDRGYIVSEYIEGQTLGELLDRGPLEPARAARLAEQVAGALAHAHGLGLVHRDLKPGNVLIDRQGQPHVTDFGLAIHDGRDRADKPQDGGTVRYMAPEQLPGANGYFDGRTDLWSLGVVLYEMLTGRLPFDGESTQDVLDQIRERTPRPPRQIDEAIPRELERICLKCLAKDVADRYATATDLARDLARWQRGRSGRSARWTAFGVAAALTTVVLATTLAVMVSSKDSSEATPQRQTLGRQGVAASETVRLIRSAGWRLKWVGTTGVSAPPRQVALLNRGSTWAYLNDGSDQGEAWRDPGFDDASWLQGQAVFGFGEVGFDGNTIQFATPLDDVVTTYFRTTFELTGAADIDALRLELLRDDGAVVYLNGHLIARDNLAADPDYLEGATPTSREDEATYFESFTFADLNPAYLVEGTNCLAVELHQQANPSSDLGFDLALYGRIEPEPEMDQYSLDLTGKRGQRLDILLSGQNGVSYVDETLQLISPDGTLLVTASPNPLGPADSNYNLGILDYVVAEEGVYTIRLLATNSGQYTLVVTDSEPSEDQADRSRPFAGSAQAVGPLAVQQFDVAHFSGEADRGVRLGTMGLASHQAQEDDNVRVRVELNQQAYAYLLAFNPDGSQQLCYPPAENVPPEELSVLEFPAGNSRYFGLTDGAGQQVFALVASRQRLPTYAQWRSRGGIVHWRPSEADGVWRFDGSGELTGQFARIRGTVRTLGEPPASLKSLCQSLVELPDVETVSVIAFPVRARSPDGLSKTSRP